MDPFNTDYLEYTACPRKYTWDQIYGKCDEGECVDMYKLGPINTAPRIREFSNLDSQVVATLCRQALTCSNMYPLHNASYDCAVSPLGCQTSEFNEFNQALHKKFNSVSGCSKSSCYR
jgi:hypothetical protein